MTKRVCQKCGAEQSASLDPIQPCKCGSNTWQLTLSDTISPAVDHTTAIAKKRRKPVAKLKAGMSMSADGTYAIIEQMVDKSNCERKKWRYKKKVTLAGGTVVKDVDGSIDDQSLHGAQEGRN